MRKYAFSTASGFKRIIKAETLEAAEKIFNSEKPAGVGAWTQAKVEHNAGVGTIFAVVSKSLLWGLYKRDYDGEQLRESWFWGAVTGARRAVPEYEHSGEIDQLRERVAALEKQNHWQENTILQLSADVTKQTQVVQQGGFFDEPMHTAMGQLFEKVKAESLGAAGPGSEAMNDVLATLNDALVPAGAVRSVTLEAILDGTDVFHTELPSLQANDEPFSAEETSALAGLFDED